MKTKLLIFFFIGYGVLLSTSNAKAILPVDIKDVPPNIVNNILTACKLPGTTDGRIVAVEKENQYGQVYIVTDCPTQLQDKSFKLVRSRFYYIAHNNNTYFYEGGALNNILGVLVPANSIPQLTTLITKTPLREEDFVGSTWEVNKYYQKTIFDSFILNSPSELTINSSMRTQNETFVTENYNGGYIKQFQPNHLYVTVGTVNLSSDFLKPIAKRTRFTSRVENYTLTADSIKFITGLERPEEISNVVYLRIDGFNGSYVFGLKISSCMQSLDGKLNNTAKVELVCPTNSQCSISGSGDTSRLTWNDDSNISFDTSITGTYPNVKFVYNLKFLNGAF